MNFNRQPVVAYIGLGTNMGDKKQHITQAIKLLSQLPEIQVLRIAPLYRTAALGYTKQDWFINTVVAVVVQLEPLPLLDYLQQIENKLQRVRTVRWGPRTIDLDLLLYQDVILNTARLTLPHPQMTKRAFVMLPLADLSPNLIMSTGQTARQLAAELSWTQKIIKLTG
ncbi:MAG: 2-amino-4-hydroxy-6-hydroxymethyldihydropteridine diphosphokinase [Desulfotomaculum sp.]|nr:2-amino-4-hydroxy-6-hydroxymethyldihydropteridine diphosphokinase [Desulfotomaculum sp.]MCL0081109.1 2-amino-4-hydroxy-6-hydroxymethyldihydropteridine diphosphokinase [Peptococcaceae bacterium]